MEINLAKASIFAASVVALVGCTAEGPERPIPTYAPLAGTTLINALPESRSPRLGDAFINDGIAFLENGYFEKAQSAFGQSLKFDPSNSSLHFLNGLTYHLRAEAGDMSQREYARIGYQMALQHDASNYWAAFQLGHMNFRDLRYRAAQDAFSYALLFEPDNQTFLRALAVASYHAKDIETAVMVADRISDRSPAFMLTGAMIYAAAGRFVDVDDYLSKYGQSESISENRFTRVQARVDDWRQAHAQDPTQLAKSNADIFDNTDNTDILKWDSGTLSSNKKHEIEQMTLVDVVIIRTEERKSTGKGVNLLSGLSSTLSGNLVTFTHTRVVNDINTGNNSLVNTFTTSPALSLSATYSLNIFNDNDDHNEVLARPSLVAHDGEMSEFFTGAVLHVELPGAAGSHGTVAKVPIGIKLEVTPEFKPDGKVKIQVKAARAFIENRQAFGALRSEPR